jgi:hypothetical protein
MGASNRKTAWRVEQEDCMARRTGMAPEALLPGSGAIELFLPASPIVELARS